MKRLTPGLLGIALAAWGAACTTPTKGTEPDPVPAGPPARWTGTAIFADDVQTTTGNWTHRFEVEVAWVKVENPSPAPPPGTTRYVPSGRVHAFIRSYSDIGSCTIDRDGEFPVTPNARPVFPEDQRLDLGPDGRYEGRLYGSWQLDYLQYCRNIDVTFQSSTTLYMSLDIAGALDGGRMRGDMPPNVITIPATLTSTRTGSWNFASN